MNSTNRVFLAASIIAYCVPNLAHAQEADNNTTKLEGEIIVTAQKREQRLSDVGITVAALSGDDLRERNIVDIKALPSVVPGLSVASSLDGYPIYSIRGVNFNATQISATPTVSTYIDEATLPYGAMTAGHFFDLERVEVLKGPQGTLFGQNATGGSINLIVAKPTTDMAAGLQISANHFGQVYLEGYISGPLSDTLRARIAATTTQFGAWQKGYFANNQNYGDANKAAARFLLDWQPTDRLTVNINLNGNYDHSQVQLLQLSRLNVQNPAGAAPGLLTYPLPPKSVRAADFDTGLKADFDNSFYQAVVRTEFKLSEELFLTSITNYADLDYRSLRDVDGTAISVLNLPTRSKIQSFSQEIRLSGDIRNFNFILGGNYQDDDIVDGNPDQFLRGYSTLPSDYSISSVFDVTNRSLAVFGNVDWDIAYGLTVTGGARYTATRQSIKGCMADTGSGTAAAFSGFLAGLFNPAASAAYVPGGCATLDTRGATPTYLPYLADLEQKQDNVSWRIGVNYKLSMGNLLYALASRGFKSGGFPVQNNFVSTQLRNVNQEQLTSYEIGAKLVALNGAVRFNASTFYYDYKDKQFFTYVPTPPVGASSTLLNIPKSTVKGFDIDFILNPLAGLKVRSAVTYIKTKIGTFSGFDVNGKSVNFSGNRFNYAPTWSGTLDAEYRFPVGGSLEAYVGGSAIYNSKTFGDLAESAALRIDPYTVYDARLGVVSDHGWRASLWVKNLTDKYYWTNALLAAETLDRITGMPRSAGATFEVTW